MGGVSGVVGIKECGESCGTVGAYSALWTCSYREASSKAGRILFSKVGMIMLPVVKCLSTSGRVVGGGLPGSAIASSII